VSTNRSMYYVYPLSKRDSFSVIGFRHMVELSKYFPIRAVDLMQFPTAKLYRNSLVLLHPYFYPLQAYGEEALRGLEVIGIDVADSDRISEYAVRLSRYASVFIVPSEWSRRAYVSSGVECDVHVVPHGVDRLYILAVHPVTRVFREVYGLKSSGVKIVSAWIIHSGYRKGYDILMELYSRLSRELEVALLLRDHSGVKLFYRGNQQLIYGGWLTEEQKMEFHDLSDLFLLTSRGGGFEHPALESIARGTPCIGAEGGSWSEYMPSWMLVPSIPSGVVLEGNPIHVGRGVEMVIDKAVDRCLEILGDVEEYKAKTRSYALSVVAEKYVWSRIGVKLRDVVGRYV